MCGAIGELTGGIRVRNDTQYFADNENFNAFMDHMADEVNHALEQSDLVIHRDFFDRLPTPFIERMKDAISKRLRSANIAEHDARSVNHRLSYYFAVWFDKEWRVNALSYAVIQNAIGPMSYWSNANVNGWHTIVT